jgi:hypothetical protein
MFNGCGAPSSFIDHRTVAVSSRKYVVSVRDRWGQENFEGRLGMVDTRQSLLARERRFPTKRRVCLREGLSPRKSSPLALSPRKSSPLALSPLAPEGDGTLSIVGLFPPPSTPPPVVVAGRVRRAKPERCWQRPCLSPCLESGLGPTSPRRRCTSGDDGSALLVRWRRRDRASGMRGARRLLPSLALGKPQMGSGGPYMGLGGLGACVRGAP